MERVRKKATREMISQEAVDWFVANREGLDVTQRRHFLGWLRTSPVHVEEYLQIAKVGQQLAAAPMESSLDLLVDQARAEEGSEDDVDVQANAPWRRRELPASPWRSWLRAVAAAAALGVMGLGFLRWNGGTLQEEPVLRFAAARGAQLTQRLSDGSVLYLNTDTSVVVRLRSSERRVEIERGEAMFEVAHDTTRPFRVIAGAAQIVAVGTKFDVYRQQPESTLVTVVEGRVRVGPSAAVGKLSASSGEGGAPGASSGEANRGGTAVAAGEQVRLVSGAVSSGPTEVDAQRATAWLRRRILFERQPLSNVAAEFNRYTRTPIEIETAELRGLAISGSFEEDDVESFVAFLRTLDGVRVEVDATRIRVSKR
jgi:transmembrane sensor